MVRLFIDAGRQDGVRPADVVGAIAGETGVPGAAIGAIDVYDRFTFVEVPAPYRDQVLDRIASVTIRNRPVRATLARPGREMRRPPSAEPPAAGRALSAGRPRSAGGLRDGPRPGRGRARGAALLAHRGSHCILRMEPRRCPLAFDDERWRFDSTIRRRLYVAIQARPFGSSRPAGIPDQGLGGEAQ
jgi:hypothetical protein